METPQRILVVDDEGIVLVALREILLREGYHVMTHSNPLLALEALKKEDFSVIITDQQMPVLTGLEFLAQARQIQPDATRILITAVLNLDTVIDAINKGEIYRFVVKPWLREELLATLKSAVQRYELTCRTRILQASALAMNEKLRHLSASFEEQAARVADQSREIERLNHELRQDTHGAVVLFSRALEAFSPALAFQARRTSHVCKILGESLGLSPAERLNLDAAAAVANIGCLAVARSVLRKCRETPEELTARERQEYQQHAVQSQEILGSVPQLKEAGDIARWHHERFDGSGYPDGLSGQNIPWLARLLAVASHYAEAANQGGREIEVIQSLSGTAFDPDAARAFLSVYPRVLSQRQHLEVSLNDLRPGMVLAKGIYTPNGSLILPEGEQLTEASIGRLQISSRSLPMNPLLLVAC